ncbi:hypothetical protein Peur_001946 [Populus x canadensis]
MYIHMHIFIKTCVFTAARGYLLFIVFHSRTVDLEQSWELLICNQAKTLI